MRSVEGDHIHITTQKENATAGVLDKFERESRVAESEIDSLTFEMNSTEEFCKRHLYALIGAC